jgi:DNA-binding transcriptional LysR family regulator
MIRLDDLQVFVSAAALGSLSAAARELDLSPALASVALKRLEQALGAQLLIRSTRSLRLTAIGAQYLEHAQQVLIALQTGVTAVKQGQQQITGELSLSIPSDLGRNLLLPWLDIFQIAHPQLSLRVRCSDRLSDLYRQPVDVAIRYGHLLDSALVAVPLVVDNCRVLCASPEFLAQHPAPKTPEDLLQYNCLQFMLGDTLHDKWQFGSGQNLQLISVRGNRVSDDGECVRRWAIAGYGIAYKSRLDALADLRMGRLIALLENYEPEPAPLYLLCAQRLSLSPAVIALHVFLKVRFAQYLQNTLDDLVG